MLLWQKERPKVDVIKYQCLLRKKLDLFCEWADKKRKESKRIRYKTFISFSFHFFLFGIRDISEVRNKKKSYIQNGIQKQHGWKSKKKLVLVINFLKWRKCAEKKCFFYTNIFFFKWRLTKWQQLSTNQMRKKSTNQKANTLSMRGFCSTQTARSIQKHEKSNWDYSCYEFFKSKQNKFSVRSFHLALANASSGHSVRTLRLISYFAKFICTKFVRKFNRNALNWWIKIINS